MTSSKSLLDMVECCLGAARVGNRELFFSMAQQARQIAGFYEVPEAAVKLLVAEGVLHAYLDDLPVALDRIRRALTLSQAPGMAGCRALALAWQSFVYFNLGKTIEAAESALDCLELTGSQSHPASLRALTILACCEMICGNERAAKVISSFVRNMSADLRDRMALSALMFDLSAIRLANARFSVICGGEEASIEIEQLLILVDSSTTYDFIIDLGVQHYLHLELRGLALSLLGRWTDALEALRRWQHEAPAHVVECAPSSLAELSWCLLQTGDEAGAAQVCSTSLATLDRVVHSDDGATACGRLSRIFGGLGDMAMAEAVDEKKLSYVVDYHSHLQELRSMLVTRERSWRAAIH